MARFTESATWRPRHTASHCLPRHDTQPGLALGCVGHGPVSRSGLPHTYHRTLGPPKRRKTRNRAKFATPRSRQASSRAAPPPTTRLALALGCVGHGATSTHDSYKHTRRTWRPQNVEFTQAQAHANTLCSVPTAPLQLARRGPPRPTCAARARSPVRRPTAQCCWINPAHTRRCTHGCGNEREGLGGGGGRVR